MIAFASVSNAKKDIAGNKYMQADHARKAFSCLIRFRGNIGSLLYFIMSSKEIGVANVAMQSPPT
jgi:hypothetical protein